MERSRLESEFKKLKESKKKAEQYSIEAKQTAQRLSAENFKLREDLSKERHLNELSRKNMMSEVERSVERLAKDKDLELVRKEVFDHEVALKASDLSRRAGNEKIYERGAYIKMLYLGFNIPSSQFFLSMIGFYLKATTLYRRRLGKH